MTKQVESEPVVGGVVVPDDDGKVAHENIAESLMRSLKRMQLWAWINQDHPEAAKNLLNQENMDKAVEVMSGSETTGGEKKEKLLEALGIKEDYEQKMDGSGLVNILDAKPHRKAELLKDAELAHGATTKSVEAWIADLSLVANPDAALVAEIEKKISWLNEKYGPKELSGVRVTEEAPWKVIEGKLDGLKIRAEVVRINSQRALLGDHDPLMTSLDQELKKAGPNQLMQVRRAKWKGTKVEKFVEDVREAAIEDLDPTKFEQLSQEDLLKRLTAANWVRANISIVDDYKLDFKERDRLRSMLASLEYRYGKRMSEVMADKWGTQGRGEEWREVAEIAMEKALNKKRKPMSARIVLNGDTDQKKIDDLTKEVTNEARKIVDKQKNARWQTNGTNGSSVEIPSPRTSGNPYEPTLPPTVIDQGAVKAALGQSDYSINEDEHFIHDLMEGEPGIERIIARANAGNPEALRGILADLRKGRRGESLKIVGELQELLQQKEYGAAANLMLAYSTKIGMQESSNDFYYMMARRQFREEIGEISGDFLQQFDMSQGIGHLPNLASQKPEEFYDNQAKVFTKGNLDIFLGSNAMMGGNVVEYGEKETTFSVKTAKALLRSHHNQLKILNADPNTMSSTLRGIVIEEMYGEGAHLHLGDQNPKLNGARELYLALPGQTVEQYQKLSDIKMNMRFAKLDTAGFNGWSENRHEVTLEQMLDRNEWMLQDGLQLMWYSEDWMDVMKSYPKASMQNTPKGLLTAASAIADYKASFELVPPPMLEVMQKLGDVLGPMSRYKGKDMVIKGVQRELIASAKEGGRGIETGKFEKIGKLFYEMHTRSDSMDVNGEDFKFANKLRSREMARLAFNDLTEDSDVVAQMVRRGFADLRMAESSIPTIAELKGYYAKWKQEKAKGITLRGKEGYFGQEYAAVWQEVDEMKMKGEKRDTWDKVTGDELVALWKVNDRVWGRKGRTYPTIGQGGTSLADAKKMFLKELEIDGFVEMTGTAHGDDWQQFGMKYAPARMAAMKAAYKIANLRGHVEDFVELNNQIDLFMPPEEKIKVFTMLATAINRATSGDLVGIDVFGLKPNAPWAETYKIPKVKEHGHGIRGSGTAEIDWINYVDAEGKEHFARTIDGTRATEMVDYQGNWSLKERGMDFYRPKHFEALLNELQMKGMINEHTKHELSAIILGNKGAVKKIVGSWNLSEETTEKIADWISKPTTWLKLQALQLFFFDDPKYAIWTLVHDYTSYFGKIGEHILGVSGGGGGHH